MVFGNDRRDEPDLIGAPERVGERLGTILTPWIRARVEAHRMQRESSDTAHITAKARALEAVLEGETPHWVAEYRALARAAMVDFSLLLELNAAAPLTTEVSCTSALVLGSRSASGHPLLLKIRDERPQHQAMGYRRIEGTLGTLFSTDPCNMGLGQGANEKGLAVANNSGGLVPDPSDRAGFNDCQVTRLMLERAGDVDEAIEVFRDLMGRDLLGLVDGVRGMIFLLADAMGGGAIIEASRDRMETLRIDDGLEVRANHWVLPGTEAFAVPGDPEHPLIKSSLVRQARGLELLEPKARIAAEDLEAFSRDEANPPFALCNGSDTFPWQTVSAFIYELDPNHDHPVRACQGLPTKTPFRQVPLFRETTPRDFLTSWNGA